MMNKLKQFIVDETGGSAVGDVISHIVYMTMTVIIMLFIISVLPVFTEYQRMENCASEIRNAIADSGGIFEETTLRIQTIQRYTTVVDSIDYTGTDFMFGTKQVQLDGDIVVRVNKNIKVAEGFSWEFEVPAHVTRYGNSNVYWKE